ncbi:MAG: hypothetical protein E7457_02785 [Ruminococcaceae bacterium]|nr:hypothetical protein [Oscillospiraceae bacterium]
MKKFSKLIAVLVALLMTLVLIPSAYAAEGAPGSTVTVRLSLGTVSSVDGTVSLSNPGLFSSVSYKVEAGSLTNGSSGNTIFCYGGGETAGVTVVVTGTISPNAADGASCKITASYSYSDADYNYIEGKSKSGTVTVKVPAAPPGGGGGGGTTPTPPPTPSGPSEPVVQIDYSELNKQIDAANKLSAEGYTDASWAALKDALNKATSMRSSKSQADVDQAAKDLAAAIAALAKVDYTALKQAIEKTETLLTNEKIGGQLKDLLTALESSKGLLTSGDQGAVDAAAKSLEDLLLALQQELDAMKIPEDGFCNITIHQVWPILFFISLAVNVAFVALAAVYVVRRKKNQKDDTPLVDYDIGDDQ